MKSIFNLKPLWLLILHLLTAEITNGGQCEERVSQNDNYHVFIDLTKIENDQVFVKMIVPKTDLEEVEFHMPKIVPGTYSIYNFGRFLSDFHAIDFSGDSIPVKKITANRWKIDSAKKLYAISYTVDDTFDDFTGNHVFEPAGTNIEAGKNFILNNHGLFGYLQDFKDRSYTLNITKAENFYGATSLGIISMGPEKDVLESENYMELVDSPIMYAIPDTTNLTIGGADIQVAVYSPGKVLSSKFVMQNIREILTAQKDYLGGELPVDRYFFIIYLYGGKENSGSYGALEHSYSSLYYLPEINPGFLAKSIRDVAAHEFFHIVTPLNIHSEEIHNFDFINPEMSRHLWLYEGVTEYASHHVQIKYKLIGIDEFLNTLRHKIIISKQFNDTIPFTELSQKCLGEHADQYFNVYHKGALIGMCLDIKLLELSKGEYDLQDLMRELANFYGKDQPFEDEKLFEQIEKLTYPEIGEFLERYVAGPEPLPLAEYFNKAGVDYIPEEKTREISMGNISFSLNTDVDRIVISDISDMNKFGQNMGYLEDDQLLSFNNKSVTPENFKEIVSEFKENAKAGDKVVAKVLRRVENGKMKEIKLKAKAIDVEVIKRHVLKLQKDPKPVQIEHQKSWLTTGKG